MSQYSKAQEDRIEAKLKAIGFVLVEDVARRRKNAGDRVMRHTDTGFVLTIDHKSTRGTEGIRLERKQLLKIKKEAADKTVPAITFSFKGKQKVYIVFDIDDLEGVMY